REPADRGGRGIRDRYGGKLNIPSRWLIYALGGGMGHLTRALALARRAARRGALVDILSNSRFAPVFANPRFRPLVTLDAGITIVPISSDAERSAVARVIERTLNDGLSPEVLIVDTFPRGLAGELIPVLESTPALKVLVHRDLNLKYVRWAELESFVADYDLV